MRLAPLLLIGLAACNPIDPGNADEALASTPAMADATTPDALAPAEARGLVRIIDGDTFEVDGEMIRLAGIDTPEMAPRAKCLAEARLAEASKAALAQVMMTSWGVRPSLERQGQDRYGRTLAVARMANGTDVGAEMVRLGYAERWPGRRVEWCGPYA